MKNRILVVEDGRTFRSLLVEDFAQQGWEVVSCETIAQANKVLADGQEFICAVLGYCLPDGQNGEVIDLILEKGMKVIVLTSKFDPDIREKFIDKGVVDYILKKSMKSVLYIIPLINRLIHNKNHLALVVDDSKIACQHVSYLLEKQYIRTIHASSGIEAINKLKQNPDITLIVADYRMPEMDGVEMVQEIRETYDKSRIAIIGISGFDDYHITAQFLKAGANDFLRKPFNHEEFYCRIHQVLDMNEATSNLYRLANQDDLTGLWNRRYLFQKANESEKAQCLAMIDIDLFKDVNDTYGHDAGDHVLIQVADILRNNLGADLMERLAILFQSEG